MCPESELGFAILDKAIMNAAVFQGAHLREASLLAADLSYTNLRGARLVDADLRGTVLRGAHLDSETVLAKAQLDAQPSCAMSSGRRGRSCASGLEPNQPIGR